MTTFVALLRSVNVAGHGRIAMADLREVFEGLGFSGVTTYIQTGNVIFGTPGRNAAKVESAIEAGLDQAFGSSPKVILRTVPELAKVAAGSPYPGQGADPARHHVTFLAATPAKERLVSFRVPDSGRDTLTIVGREVYVHTPDGYADSKLTGAFLERHLGVSSTTRNWNTVTKLAALAGG